MKKFLLKFFIFFVVTQNVMAHEEQKFGDVITAASCFASELEGGNGYKNFFITASSKKFKEAKFGVRIILVKGNEKKIFDIENENLAKTLHKLKDEAAYFGELKNTLKCQDISKDDHDLYVNWGEYFIEKKSLKNRAQICIATSQVYNNWDCYIYDKAKKDLVLWYSQENAD